MLLVETSPYFLFHSKNNVEGSFTKSIILEGTTEADCAVGPGLQMNI